MVNLIVSAEMGVILFQCIVTMGAGTDNLLYTIAVHGFNIHLGQRLVEVFVPSPHGRITTASLFVPQDTEAYAGFLQYLRKGNGYLLSSIIEGS